MAYPNVKKDSSAATAAGRLLRNVEIKSYIDEQLEQMHNERTADAKEILEYLTAVMRGEETETVATAKGLYDGVEVSAKDRLKAAELLGKRHALFTDKQQIEVTEMPVFVDDIGDDDG